MHKYNKLFFSVLIFLVACSGNKTPDGILSQPVMTNLLTDIHIVDGSMYTVIQVPDTLYKYGTSKYQLVFHKYHTDSLQFKKSFRYYASNPEQLETIYEQISKNIKQKSDSLNKLSLAKVTADDKRRTDSLSKLPKHAQPQTPVAAQPGKSNPGKNIHPPLKPHKRKNVDPIK